MHKQTMFLLLTTLLVVSTGCSKQAIQLGMQQGEPEPKRAKIATDRPTTSEHLDSEHDMEIESWIDRLIKDDLLELYTDNGIYIYIDLPPWLTVQQIKTLITYLCKVKPVDRLRVYLRQLPKADVPQMLVAVISALEGSFVSSLDLMDHNFSDTRIAPDLLHKAFALLQKTKVEYLCLYDCWFGDNICALLTALKETSVRSIDLSLNQLNDIEEEMLRQAFSALKDTKIEWLNLEDNHLSTKALNLFPALQGTSIRCLKLDGNQLFKIEPSQLSEAFSLFQGTNVEVLSLVEDYDNYDYDGGEIRSFQDWSLDDICAFLSELSATKVQKIRLSYYENLPQELIDEFNIKIAYPHDTVYHDNGLKRACMRAMLQNIANLERVGEFERLPEKLKQDMRAYKKDEHPGLGLKLIDNRESPHMESSQWIQ